MDSIFTPITAFYAALCALVYIFLSIAVARQRWNFRIGIGDGGNKILARWIRVHANFIEYVPFALVLMLLTELNGGSSALLHGCGAALLIARVCHAFGLRKTAGASWQRMVGVLFTFLCMLVLIYSNLSLFLLS
jgi:uncharacterized membrane protein YecN with MAPEG domain